MNPTAEHEFRGELRAGERLLWAGRPWQGVGFVAGDLAMVPFSLMWGGFAVFWEVMAIRQGAPLFFMLWGVPFVLMGIYMIVGRFFWDAFRRSKTAYALTDQRVLVVSDVFGRKLRSLSLSGLPQLELAFGKGRAGTITFGSNNTIPSWFQGTGWPGVAQTLPPRFEGIDNVRDVHERILRTQQEHLKGGSAS